MNILIRWNPELTFGKKWSCWCPYVTDPRSKCDVTDGPWERGTSVNQNWVLHRHQVQGIKCLSQWGLCSGSHSWPLPHTQVTATDCTQTERPSVYTDFLFPPGPHLHTPVASPSSFVSSFSDCPYGGNPQFPSWFSLSISYVPHLYLLRRCQSTLLKPHGVSSLFLYVGRIGPLKL